jgi:hypothetical protein
MFQQNPDGKMKKKNRSNMFQQKTTCSNTFQRKIKNAYIYYIIDYYYIISFICACFLSPVGTLERWNTFSENFSAIFFFDFRGCFVLKMLFSNYGVQGVFCENLQKKRRFS